jgi:hypothetical protein
MSTDPAGPGGQAPRTGADAAGPGGPSPRGSAGQLPLGDYIRALVRLLDEEEPPSAQRLRRAVGPHVAHIRLDQQAVLVSFTGTALTVRDAAGPDETAQDETAQDGTGPGKAADGSGGTDSATVRDLLAGRLEITDAITSGRIEVSGNSAGLTGILFAIEILLDAAARVPGLRTLAAGLQEPSPAPGANPNPNPEPGPEPGPGDITSDPELRLLARLDLLPPRRAQPKPSSPGPGSRPGP